MRRIDKGYTFINNEGYQCKVLSKDGKKVTVEIDGQYVAVFWSQHVRSGTVKNPFHPEVLGKGFVGVGKHITSKGGVTTTAYNRWRGMLFRCYGDRSKNESYEGVEVCEDWLNFQNFADWFYSQNNYVNNGWEIDKDLLGDGLRLYSPSTCCMLPKELNIYLNSLNRKGYCWHVKNNRWFVSVRVHGKQMSFGYFNDEARAVAVANCAKQIANLAVLEKWEGRLEEAVYTALQKKLGGVNE